MFTAHDLTTAARKSLLLATAGALSLTSSCHVLPDPSGFVIFPEAHARNLEELHRADGSYKYNGRLLGDWGYLVEELQNGDRANFISASRIPSPSSETVENLVQLLAAKHSDPAARAQQLQWCARLVQSDQSELVRELAAGGLTEIALSMGIKELDLPDPSLEPASPDELASIFEDMLRELRLSEESEDYDSDKFAVLCREASELTLDLDGARRLHGIATNLLQLDMNGPNKVNVQALVLELEKDVIEIALFEALIDGSDRVAAAGLEGFVRIEGPARLVPLLTQNQNRLSPELEFNLLRLLRTHGLSATGLSPELYARCITSLVALSTEHPSSRVRVQGMLALKRLIPDGPRSLREEDWARWHTMVFSDPNTAP